MTDLTQPVPIAAPPMSLNKTDWQKIVKDIMYFAAGPILIYLDQVQVLLQIPHHVFSAKDLIPNALTIGAVVGYVISQLQNIFRKYVS